MRIPILLGAVLAAGTASAGSCGPDRDADIPLIEDAKQAFLDSEYKALARIAGPYFPDLESNFVGYFGGLQRVFPQGFDRCETILQRRETPGFYQDLVLYFPKGSSAPMALHLVAADVGGEARLIELNYNTNISDVLDELK